MTTKSDRDQLISTLTRQLTRATASLAADTALVRSLEAQLAAAQGTPVTDPAVPLVLSGATFTRAGARWRAYGANSYDLFDCPDPAARLQALAAAGATAVRAWCFPKGGKADAAYLAHALTVLDQAAALGLYVTVVLGNNWDDWGGPACWGTDEAGFYADPAVVDRYAAYVSATVQGLRRGSGLHPAVLGVTPVNEARPRTVAVAQAWLDRMAAAVLSVVPTARLVLGMEGHVSTGYGQAGAQWPGVPWPGCDLTALDLTKWHVLTVHAYRKYVANNDPGQLAAAVAPVRALAARWAKPLLLEECGFAVPDDGTAAQRTAWLAAGAALGTQLDGALVWQAGADGGSYTLDPAGPEVAAWLAMLLGRAPAPVPAPSPLPLPSGPKPSDDALQARLDALQPGEVFVLPDGVYKGTYALRVKGTAAQPITVKGSRAAVLQGDGSGYGLHFDRATYVTATGFTVTGSQKGVILDESPACAVEGLYVHHHRQEGIHARNNSADCKITKNEVCFTGTSSPAYGEGIYVGLSAGGWSATYSRTGGQPDRTDRVVVEDNYCHDNAAECVDVKEGTTGTVVRANRLDLSGLQGANYADSAVDLKGTGALVEGNTIQGSSPHAQDGIQTHMIGTTPPVVSGSGNTIRANHITATLPGYGVAPQKFSTNTVSGNDAPAAAKGVASVPQT